MQVRTLTTPHAQGVISCQSAVLVLAMQTERGLGYFFGFFGTGRAVGAWRIHLLPGKSQKTGVIRKSHA